MIWILKKSCQKKLEDILEGMSCNFQGDGNQMNLPIGTNTSGAGCDGKHGSRLGNGIKTENGIGALEAA